MASQLQKQASWGRTCRNCLPSHNLGFKVTQHHFTIFDWLEASHWASPYSGGGGEPDPTSWWGHLRERAHVNPPPSRLHLPFARGLLGQACGWWSSWEPVSYADILLEKPGKCDELRVACGNQRLSCSQIACPLQGRWWVCFTHTSNQSYVVSWWKM